MIKGIIAQEFENTCYLYEKICLFCGIAAVVFLLLSAILFFVLRIPQAWETFAGRPARKEAGNFAVIGDTKSVLGAETSALELEENSRAAMRYGGYAETSALAPEEEGTAQGLAREQETVLLEGEVIRR